MQHDREPLARKTLIEMHVVERAPAHTGQAVPVPMHVDEFVVHIDIGVLIRRRKENVITRKACGERDAPREADGRRPLGHGRRRRIVILLPVKIARTKSDDVLVLRIPLQDGVFGTHLGIERRCEKAPCEYARSDEE